MPETIETKRRYRVLRYSSIGGRNYSQGEYIDTAEVPEDTLAVLAKDGTLEYVDTMRWQADEVGDGGTWEVDNAAPTPEAVAAPVAAKATEQAQEPETPASGQQAAKTTTDKTP